MAARRSILSYVPLLCGSRKFHPILSELQPGFFVERVDRDLCLFEAFLGFIEEPIYTALGQG